jgi:hypothetical protein
LRARALRIDFIAHSSPVTVCRAMKTLAKAPA